MDIFLLEMNVKKMVQLFQFYKKLQYRPNNNNLNLMQEDPKQKQDEFIALQNTLQNFSGPQKLQINLFIPLGDVLSQKLQPPQSQMGIPNIQEQIIKTSRLNQNLQDQKVKKSQKNKRKYSQKSQHYHRVQNSRKIKTKKVNKDYLQRSQCFYFDTVNQGGDDSKIMSLLNQYEAFHQAIFNSCFEKKVIKLSHYGNKCNKKKNSDPQVLNLKNLTINENFGRSRSFKDGYLNLNKTFSKSLVQKHSPKIFSASEVTQNKKSQINFQAKNEVKKSDFYYKVNKDINKKLVPQNNLSKHTTPIRTIFLNQTEKNVTYQNIANQSSPNHNVSSFTPLISQRVHKKPSLKPFKSILQNPVFNYSHKKYEMKSQNDQQLNVKDSQKRSPNNNKLGISIITKKDYYEKTQSNIEVSDILRNGLSRNSHTLDEIILTEQITLPCNPYRHKSNHNLGDLQKFNFTLTSKQSESRSRSKKGLSLTQSAASIKTKNQLSKISSKSITKIVHKKQQKKENPLDKKLNFTYSNIPKRVQIRIY